MNGEARPRCAYCWRELTDQDITGGLCPSCGQSILPKEPRD